MYAYFRGVYKVGLVRKKNRISGSRKYGYRDRSLLYALLKSLMTMIETIGSQMLDSKA